MNTEQFISMIAPAVIENCKKHGWGVPSAIIGQAILESMKSSGLSGLASSCNNFYGMKWKDGCGCDYKAYTTAEQRSDGSYYNVVAKFRKYPTASAGIDGYFKFIESYKRYKPVMAAKDYKQYALQLKQCGWATSLNYTNNIIAKVEKFNLTRFDSAQLSTPQSDLDTIAYEVINHMWGNGTTRKLRLEQAGYNYQEVQNRVNEILKAKK